MASTEVAIPGESLDVAKIITKAKPPMPPKGK